MNIKCKTCNEYIKSRKYNAHFQCKECKKIGATIERIIRSRDKAMKLKQHQHLMLGINTTVPKSPNHFIFIDLDEHAPSNSLLAGLHTVYKLDKLAVWESSKGRYWITSFQKNIKFDKYIEILAYAGADYKFIKVAIINKYGTLRVTPKKESIKLLQEYAFSMVNSQNYDLESEQFFKELVTMEAMHNGKI